MDRRILSYLMLAFAFSWAMAGVAYALGLHSTAQLAYTLVAGLFMLGPALAALVQHRLIDKEPWSALGLPLKGTRWSVVGLTALAGMSIVPLYFLVIWLAGDVCGWAGFGEVSVSGARFARAVGDMMRHAGQDGLPAQVEFLRDLPGWVVLLLFLFMGLLASVTINLPFMLGEELGWRGYLYHRTRHWSRSHRVLFTGIVWGLWHAPLIAMGHNYPGYPLAGMGMMVLFCLVLSFLFDLTRMRSGSIWSSCVLHGLINGTAGAAGIFAWDGHVLMGSIAGVAGCIAVALVAVAFHLLSVPRTSADQTAVA